jgi:hypothetical protein
MPRNGTGSYALPNPDVVTGTPISSADENATRADIAAAITGSLARDGQGGMTGNLPMGGFRITGLADAAADTDAVTRQQVVLQTALPLAVASGGTGATTPLDARANLNAAPQPSGSGIGTMASVTAPVGDALVLPAGGTWFFDITGITSGNLWAAIFNSGIVAGGTTIGSATPGVYFKALIWRIT